MQMQGTMTRIE